MPFLRPHELRSSSEPAIGIGELFQGGRGRCICVLPSCDVCLLAHDACRGRDECMGTGRPGYAPSYPAADQRRARRAANRNCLPPANRRPAKTAPPTISALPPAQDNSNADLAKRVSDLEKQLAAYAKAAADSQVTSTDQTSDCPQRPDSVGRGQLQPKRRQHHAVRQRPKFRGLPPRKTRTVGRIRADRLYHRDGLRQPRHQLRGQSTKRTNPPPSRTCTSKCGTCP